MVVLYSTEGKQSLTPDHDVIFHLSTLYANAHSFMTIVGNCPQYNFTDGITNGAEWYPLTGGMQDYNYIYAGCLEVTLEVSCCKFPNASELQRHWEADRDPLLLYLMQINMGVRGIVRDQHNHPVEGAVISIQGRELIKSKTNQSGRVLETASAWTLQAAGIHEWM
nr:hypothetical protein BaRGS_030095 [Batillaria attramentaria]